MSAELYKVREAAQLLNIGRTTLYDYIRTGKIKTVRFGRAIRISVEEINRLKREGVA